MTTESEPRRVAAIMMIRDECDIIEANIRHHARLGVDHFVILDHGSADGTADILRALTTEGLPLTVLTYARDAEIELSQWYAALFARVRELGAEIVVQIDGDEFWHLTTGSFAKLDWSAPVITAPRFNMFAPRAAVGSPDGAPMTHIYRNRRPFHPEDYRSRVTRGDRDIAFDYPIHMVRIEPKVVFLLEEMGEIMMAGHGIISHAGEMLQPKPDGSAVIFHYPLRSFEQFAKKVAAFGTVFEKHPHLDRGISWQTRYLWELDEPGALERAFLRCFPDEAELRHWIDTGVLVRDTRMARDLTDGPGTLDAELDHLAITADRVIMDLIEDLSVEQRAAAAGITAERNHALDERASWTAERNGLVGALDLAAQERDLAVAEKSQLGAEIAQVASGRDAAVAQQRRLTEELARLSEERDFLAAETDRLATELANVSGAHGGLVAHCAVLSEELNQIRSQRARPWVSRLPAWMRRH
ncbi:glycosyltransferase family 2 protein [Sphingomonas pokkalii]|uniref:Uncharacterized protein n=1 Tax=Sphingomonas pokkalii TaxID=2175090 RepID=A0A2U0SDI7_9SPHN|nr:glycosyltransferase family 2 protein [Sphingomonas pokkalii]PVX29354.1 hypothetical protein DD559_08510 [Sphingomonas pokkalii]